MLTFRVNYFVLTLLLFVIEVYIALFIDDDFVRPYVGDLLVVILMYSFIRSFFKASVLKIASGVLIFSFLVEFLQYFKVLKIIGLQHSNLANIIFGNSFEWIDLLAYTFGILIVITGEKIISLKKCTNPKSY